VLLRNNSIKVESGEIFRTDYRKLALNTVMQDFHEIIPIFKYYNIDSEYNVEHKNKLSSEMAKAVKLSCVFWWHPLPLSAGTTVVPAEDRVIFFNSWG
jgi:hypothetical protein